MVGVRFRYESNNEKKLKPYSRFREKDDINVSYISGDLYTPLQAKTNSVKRCC